jgi:hypothetical protein
MTFGERFYLTTRDPWRRLLRNVRLLGYIASLIWKWLVLGSRVRRACSKARRTGTPYFIDELGSQGISAKHVEEKCAR